MCFFFLSHSLCLNITQASAEKKICEDPLRCFTINMIEWFTDRMGDTLNIKIFK